tara:strand:- start:11471 stop:11626 length:156 start_codon:yes stop_codon:yes gene_type:complete
MKNRRRSGKNHTTAERGHYPTAEREDKKIDLVEVDGINVRKKKTPIWQLVN